MADDRVWPQLMVNSLQPELDEDEELDDEELEEDEELEPQAEPVTDME